MDVYEQYMREQHSLAMAGMHPVSQQDGFDRYEMEMITGIMPCAFGVESPDLTALQFAYGIGEG